mgnify:CR=1 FL=1
MKDKNLPDDNNSKSLEELTQEVNSIIEELEKKEDIKNSLDDYQKLIKLNNIIVRKFQKKSKYINEITQQKIRNIVNKKNAKKT